MTPTILVLGIGNPLLGDEGIGPRGLEELARLYSLPPEVELLEGGTRGLSLLAEITRVEKLLILDAVQTGAPPGTVMALNGQELPRDATPKLSPHEIGIDDVLSAARLFGSPREVVILGIEPEAIHLGWGLSPAVARALPRLVEEARRQLEKWGIEVSKCTS